MTTYTTITDVIAQYIAPALGTYASDYDLTAIAHDITRFNEHGQLEIAHEDDFYDIAARHEI